MILEALCVGAMQVNCYVLASSINSEAIIIDPGDEDGKIKKVLSRHKLKAGIVINTHGHIDHIGCDDKFDVSVYIHRLDAALLKDPGLNLSSYLAGHFKVKSKIRALEDKEEIILGGVQLEVIHVPGHTPGGIALLMKKPEGKILFSGDTLFCQGVGRSDFPGSDGQLLVKSIRERLFNLDDDTVVYPGHGPSSTIGEEKKSNPLLM